MAISESPPLLLILYASQTLSAVGGVGQLDVIYTDFEKAFYHVDHVIPAASQTTDVRDKREST